MEDNDSEKLLISDHLAIKMTASPVPNYALQQMEQLTPISRILQGQKTEDICQTESPGMSPALSPATPVINYKLRIRELEQKIEMIKKDKHSLENTLMSEQQARENLENMNSDLEHKIKNNNQKLARNKKEIDELRQENDKMWNLTEERDDLLYKNAVFRQRVTKLTEQEEEISVLQRSIQHLTERNAELEKEVVALNNSKINTNTLNAQIAEQQATIDEYQVTCSMQEQELKSLVDSESKHKQEYAMLKELFDAQKLEINASGTGTPDVSFFQGETMNVVTQIEMQELKEKLEEVQGSWMDPQKVNDLKQKLEESEKRICNEKERYKDLFNSYEQKLQAIGTLEAENQNLHETIAETNREFETVQQDFSRIRKNADSVIQQHKDASSEIELLTHKVAALTSENGDLIANKALMERFIDNYNTAFKNGIKALKEAIPSSMQKMECEDPAVFEPTAVSVNILQPQLVDAIGNVHSYIESVKMANSKSCKENLELSRQVESLQEEKKNLTLSLEKFNLMLNSTKEELENRNTENAKLQSDIDMLNKENSASMLDASNNKEQFGLELSRLQSQVTDLQKENEELEAKVAEHFSTIQAMQISWLTPTKADEMKNELIQLKEKCCSLEQDLDAKDTAFTERISELGSENDNLHVIIKDIRTEKETTEERHASECLELERKLLEAQYASSQEVTSQLEAKETEWRDKVETLKTQVLELESSNGMNNLKLSEQQKLIDGLEDQKRENDMLIVTLKSHNAELIREKEIATNRNSELLVSNDELTSKVQELNQTVANHAQDFTTLGEKYASKETELRTDLEDMKSKFNELLHTLQESEGKATMDTSQTAEHGKDEDGLKSLENSVLVEPKAALNDLQRQLDCANTLIAQQQASLEERSSELERQASRSSELTQTVAQLENQLQSLSQASLLKENALQEELGRSRREQDDMESVMSDLRDRESAAQREIATRDHEVEIARLRYAEAEEQLVKAKVEHSFAAETFESRLLELGEGKRDLEQKIEAMEGKAVLYESHIKKSDANLVQQKVEYESRVISLENKLKQLERELSDARDMSTTANSFDLNGNGTILTPNKLLRSLSEDCLSTPTNKMMSQNNDFLNDSLEFAKPQPLTSRPSQRPTPSLSSTLSLETPSKQSLSRSCMSVESSLLGPPNQSQQQGQPPHAFSTGDLSNDPWPVFPPQNSHTSNFELSSRRVTLGPNEFIHRQAGRPSLLGLPVLEEPDDPNYSCSLKRIAELQERNSRQPSHLKSSYPVETQSFSSDGSASNNAGKTPSKCDETIRVGSARDTMKKMGDGRGDLAASSEKMSIIRSLPGYRSSSSLQANRDQRRAPSAAHGIKRKQVATLEPDMQWDITSPKNRRETIAGPFATASSINKLTVGSTNENARKTRVQCESFMIANTPPPNLGNRRRRPRKRSPPALAVPSGPSKTSKKTPEKSMTTRQRAKEAGKKTPSLMERMRKPLGRLNPKK